MFKILFLIIYLFCFLFIMNILKKTIFSQIEASSLSENIDNISEKLVDIADNLDDTI